MYRKRWMIHIAFWAGVLFLTGGPVVAQSSPSYALKPCVISGGGYKTTSLNYTLLSTVGQSSAIGISLSHSFIHYAGFWHALRLNLHLLSREGVLK